MMKEPPSGPSVAARANVTPRLQQVIELQRKGNTPRLAHAI